MNKDASMQKLIREAYEKVGLNGAWLYAENGEIVSKGAIGWRDPENKFPITEDSIFQLGSVTKQFTLSAFLKLFLHQMTRVVVLRRRQQLQK